MVTRGWIASVEESNSWEGMDTFGRAISGLLKCDVLLSDFILSVLIMTVFVSSDFNGHFFRLELIAIFPLLLGIRTCRRGNRQPRQIDTSTSTSKSSNPSQVPSTHSLFPQPRSENHVSFRHVKHTRPRQKKIQFQKNNSHPQPRAQRPRPVILRATSLMIACVP